MGFFGFITNWIDSIRKSNDQQIKDGYELQLLNKQKALDATIEQLTMTTNSYKNSAELVKRLIVEKDNLSAQIETLKKQLNPVPATKPNLNVDWTKRPYFPQTRRWIYSEKEKAIVERTFQFTPSKFTRIWSDELYQFAMGINLGGMTLRQQAIAIRDAVLSVCVYQYDENAKGLTIENWKLPHETFADGFGDCEDLTNLWLCICNIRGLSSQRVFNVTGFYGTTGHSYGGSFIDDDNTFWILECTSKLSPTKMKGSNYTCTGLLKGISNWDFAGLPLQDQF